MNNLCLQLTLPNVIYFCKKPRVFPVVSGFWIIIARFLISPEIVYLIPVLDFSRLAKFTKGWNRAIVAEVSVKIQKVLKLASFGNCH